MTHVAAGVPVAVAIGVLVGVARRFAGGKGANFSVA
jgi:hypothetical protein